MDKDWDGWSQKKQEMHNHEVVPFFHEREVWWCSLGVNVGSEQDGTGKNYDRPIAIIRGFNKDIFFGVALTGKRKAGRYYFYLGNIEGRDASAILSQVRIIDAKRLVRKAMTLDQALFTRLKAALQKTLLPLN